MLKSDKDIYLRGVIRSRNSYSVNLPLKLCKLLGLDHNSFVKIEVDEEKLIITKINIDEL